MTLTLPAPPPPTVLNVKPSYIEIDKAVSFTMHEILTFTDLTPDGYSVDVIVMGLPFFI